MNAPVVITFATALPETVPNIPLVMHETFAGPPAECPASPIAKSINKAPVPVLSTRAPKRINNMTYVADTYNGIPRIPSVPIYICSITRSSSTPPIVNA